MAFLFVTIANCVKGTGRYYQGHHNQSQSGIPCQTWFTKEPHEQSSPPEGIRSQRLAELGVSCVVHAATVLGNTNKGKGMIVSHADGIDIINANLEDGGNNLEIFESFSEKMEEVQKKKGVALVISDESSPSINQR